MLSLIPRGHDSTSPTPLPRWRDFADKAPSGMTYAEIFRGADNLVQRLQQDVGESADRWCEMLEHLGQFSIERVNGTIEILRSQVVSWSDNDLRNRIRDRLRKLIYHNRQFQNADWALPPEILDSLEVIHEVLVPEDQLERLSWLFANQWEVSTLRPRSEDWQENEKQAKQERIAAVEDIIARLGHDAIRDFAHRVGEPWLVGEAIANSKCDEEVKTLLLGSFINSDDQSDKQVARALAAHLHAIQGPSWTDRTLHGAQGGSWSESAILIFLLSLPSTRYVWSKLAEFDPRFEAEYWSSTHVFMAELVDTDLQYVIRKLINAGRSYIAAQVAVQRLEKISVELLIEILRALAAAQTLPDGENSLQMLQYYLERILGFLDAATEVDRNEIARLEWAFLPLLRHSQRGLAALHGAISREPSLYVEVLSALYRADPEEEGTQEDAAEVDTVRARVQAERAYHLLSSWHVLPGQFQQEVDPEALSTWVTTARTLCKSAKRSIIGDIYIGKMLAHAPNGKDGYWPVEAVRDLVQGLRSKHVEDGIETGLHNKRGVIVRSPRDGGALERAEATRYEMAARALKGKWPRISKVLTRVSASYQSQAKSMDDEVQRREWS